MGMCLAVAQLVDLGHKRVAHVAGPLSASTGTLRRDGFERAMSHRGLRGLVREATGYTRQAGAQAGAHLLAAGPEITAILAAQHLLALGVLDALEERGVRRPDDM